MLADCMTSVTEPYVLIADSHPRIANVIARLVERLRPGLKVECQGEGQAVLERLGLGFPELIVIDTELPGSGGFELLRYIRGTKQGAHLPVILTSPRVDAASVRAVLPLSPTAYLARPLDQRRMSSRLDALLPAVRRQAESAPLNLDAFLDQQNSQGEGSPVLIDVTRAVTGFLQAKERDLGSLSRELARDPQVTARLLVAANSAGQGAGAVCKTLSQSLQRLGLVRALNLVLGLSLERCARLQDPSLAALAGQQYELSQRCAELARWLAGHLALDADLCQTAGLLHNIGELALLRCLQHWLDQGYSLSEEQIQQVLQQRSAAFGSSLRIRWRLPLGLRELIAAYYGMSNGVHGREALVLTLTAELLKLAPEQLPQSLQEGRTARMLRLPARVLDELPLALLGR